MSITDIAVSVRDPSSICPTGEATDPVALSSKPLRPLKGHFPALDGLRGIAILMVMFAHLMHVPFGAGHSIIDRLAAVPISLGWMGVDLFFVLSGFLITGILWDSKGSTHYFRNFYARRTVRIFPLYYFFLVVILLIAPRLNWVPSAVRLQPPEGQWSYWMYLSSMVMGFHGGTTNGALTGTWSLAIEEQFYLFWPLVLFFCSRRRTISLCALMLGFSLALRLLAAAWLKDTSMVYFVTPFRLDGLATGACIALILRGPNGLKWLAEKARVLGPIFFFGLFASVVALQLRHATARGDRWLGQTVFFSFSAFAFGSCLVWAIAKPPRFMSLPFFRFFGRYSYSLYLFHYPVSKFVDLFINPDRLPAIHGVVLPAALAYTALCIALSVGVALITWNLLEKHFLKLKVYFPEERGTAPIAGSMPTQVPQLT